MRTTFLIRTISVLLVTGATAFVVFGSVSLASSGASTQTGIVAVSNTADASASSSTVQTCPATGCTASSCHATTGQAPGGGSGYGRGAQQPYEQQSYSY